MRLKIEEKDIFIPDCIYLGAKKYTVNFPYKFNGNEYKYAGMVDNITNEIQISDEYGNRKHSQDNLLQIFCHELVHAIDNVYCGNAVGDADNGERLIDGIASGIAQFIIQFMACNTEQ